MKLFKPLLFVFLTVSIAFFIAGCASMTTGNKQVVHITSFPEGATVKYKRKELGKTPLTAKIRRASGFNALMLTLDGYQPTYYPLDRKITPTTYLDILNPIGLCFDLLSGAAVTYNAYHEISMEYLDTAGRIKQSGREYNTRDHFYVITTKGDTIYSRPNGKITRKNFVYYKLPLERKVKTSMDSIFAYKSVWTMPKHKKRKYGDYFDNIKNTSVSVSHKQWYGSKVMEKKPLNPKKPTRGSQYLRVALRNGNYKLMEQEIKSETTSGTGAGAGFSSISGFYTELSLNPSDLFPEHNAQLDYNAKRNYRYIPTISSTGSINFNTSLQSKPQVAYLYYLYNGETYVGRLKRKNYEEWLLQYFDNCPAVKDALNTRNVKFKDVPTLTKIYQVNCENVKPDVAPSPLMTEKTDQ